MDTNKQLQIAASSGDIFTVANLLISNAEILPLSLFDFTLGLQICHPNYRQWATTDAQKHWAKAFQDQDGLTIGFRSLRWLAQRVPSARSVLLSRNLKTIRAYLHALVNEQATIVETSGAIRGQAFNTGFPVFTSVDLISKIRIRGTSLEPKALERLPQLFDVVRLIDFLEGVFADPKLIFDRYNSNWEKVVTALEKSPYNYSENKLARARAYVEATRMLIKRGYEVTDADLRPVVEINNMNVLFTNVKVLEKDFSDFERKMLGTTNQRVYEALLANPDVEGSFARLAENAIRNLADVPYIVLGVSAAAQVSTLASNLAFGTSELVTFGLENPYVAQQVLPIVNETTTTTNPQIDFDVINKAVELFQGMSPELPSSLALIVTTLLLITSSVVFLYAKKPQLRRSIAIGLTSSIVWLRSRNVTTEEEREEIKADTVELIETIIDITEEEEESKPAPVAAPAPEPVVTPVVPISFYSASWTVATSRLLEFAQYIQGIEADQQPATLLETQRAFDVVFHSRQLASQQTLARAGRYVYNNLSSVTESLLNSEELQIKELLS